MQPSELIDGKLRSACVTLFFLYRDLGLTAKAAHDSSSWKFSSWAWQTSCWVVCTLTYCIFFLPGEARFDRSRTTEDRAMLPAPGNRNNSNKPLRFDCLSRCYGNGFKQTSLPPPCFRFGRFLCSSYGDRTLLTCPCGPWPPCRLILASTARSA